ncbi:hypothetical protein WJX75_009554 [Coccomyxa subellipsoidea]|uniref:Uncharacterized protein n=1 Tax=Coccomyxa subellipsoidea TaxID=248742 RepID=A0ABR2YLK2_9CHLO
MFMISMTWLEEPTSPGLEAAEGSSQGSAGWPRGSPSSNGLMERSRLEEAARHEDLEGSFSTRAWRDADKPPNPNTEQRRRSCSLGSSRSPSQARTMPMGCSDEWRIRKVQEEEECDWTGGVSKQGAVGGSKAWQRAKAD